MTSRSTVEGRSLSVILPAYDEAQSLPGVLEEACVVLSGLVERFELLVVDDGSTDGTYDVARALGHNIAEVRVVRHETNRGMGAAVRTGMAHARYEFVCDVCADGQFDFGELPEFLRAMAAADVAVGHRVQQRMSRRRRISLAVSQLLIRLFFGLEVRDPAWTKMWRRAEQDVLAPTADGFFWETEFLVRAHRAGLHAAEVESRARERTAGVAKGGEFRRIVRAIGALVVFWWHRGYDTHATLPQPQPV